MRGRYRYAYGSADGAGAVATVSSPNGLILRIALAVCDALQTLMRLRFSTAIE